MSSTRNNTSAASRLMSELTGLSSAQLPNNRTRRGPLSRSTLIREINQFHINCEQLIYTITQFAPHLRSQEVVNATNVAEITKVANIVFSDFKTLRERLAELNVRKTAMPNIVADDDLHMESFSLGEAYSNWILDYNSALLPVFNQLVELVHVAIHEATLKKV